MDMQQSAQTRTQMKAFSSQHTLSYLFAYHYQLTAGIHKIAFSGTIQNFGFILEFLTMKQCLHWKMCFKIRLATHSNYCVMLTPKFVELCGGENPFDSLFVRLINTARCYGV